MSTGPVMLFGPPPGFLEVVDAFCRPNRGGKVIEIRWRMEGDGNTKWHPLESENGVFRSGLFPWQADYRLRPDGETLSNEKTET